MHQLTHRNIYLRMSTYICKTAYILIEYIKYIYVYVYMYRKKEGEQGKINNLVESGKTHLNGSIVCRNIPKQ